MTKKSVIAFVLICLISISLSGCFQKSDSSVKINKKTTSATDAKEKLTSDYFIPAKFSSMKYSMHSTGPQGEEDIIWSSSWEKDKDMYIQTYVDENNTNWADTYRLTSTGVNWISTYFAQASSEWEKETIAKGNNCCKFKFVSPGVKWLSKYQSNYEGAPEIKTTEESYVFVDFEEITVIGEKMNAAHIRSTTKFESQNIKIDNWYVKGLGLVRSQSTNKNEYGIDSTTTKLVAK